MKRVMMMSGFIMMLLLGVSPQAHAAKAEAPEDWGLHCFHMQPYADVLTLRLVRPNPPEWNLDAQARWNGMDVYVLPGGGDVRTDIDEQMYAVRLVLHNPSIFFNGHPVVTVNGVLGGPWSLEAKGKLNVPTYVVQGTIEGVPCTDAAVAQSMALSRAQLGMTSLAGAQQP